jgi:hypothetical protein
MTHSNIDLIRSIKYKYSNTENVSLVNAEEHGATHSLHKFMKTLSHTTQSMTEKISNFKQATGYTSSNSFAKSGTHSFFRSSTHSFVSSGAHSLQSRVNYSFSGLSSSNLNHAYLGEYFSYSKGHTFSYSFNNSVGTYSHKFFTKVNHSIRKIDNQNFINAVSIINGISLNDAEELIINKKVTVNGLVVTDIEYQLSSLDIVRIGFEGHYLNNPNGIAIIK